MSTNLKRIFSCILVICLTLSFITLADKVTVRKASIEKYSDFFKEKENFDVLFFGTSHTINGIFPMELWNEYGITSYNFGGHANYIPTSYWVMKNALDYTTPQVVVLDLHNISAEFKTFINFSYIHNSFDAFPISVNKIRAAFDLGRDDDIDNTENIDLVADDLMEVAENATATEKKSVMGLAWTFSVFHSRWSSLTTKDFHLTPKYEKGAESRNNVNSIAKGNLDCDDIIKIQTLGMEYIEKFIKDCQKKGIEVVLTYLPYTISKSAQIEANTGYLMAEKYGVKYINFLKTDVIDYQTDMYDNTHLNSSGARKVTNYLGRVLSEEYEIEDKRNNTDYCERWNRDYEEYTVNVKDKNLVKAKNIEKYLMLLSQDDLMIDMVVSDSRVYSDDIMTALIDNVGEDRLYIENIEDEESYVYFKVYRDEQQIDCVKFIMEVDEEGRLTFQKAKRK